MEMFRLKRIEKPTPLDVGHQGRLMLWIFGLYVGDRLKPNPWRNIIRPFLMLYLAALPILIIAKPILEKQDFLDKWSSIHFFVAHGWVSFKLLIYSARSSTTSALEELLKIEIFNRNIPSQTRFIDRAIKNIEMYMLCFWSCPIIVGIVYMCLVPFIADNFIVPMWIPWDFGNILWHFYQGSCYILSVIAYVAIESVILSFVANIICQFQILSENLKNSCHRDPNEIYVQQEKRIQDRLRQCVIHHEAILSFVYEVERTFSMVLFCQIIYSILAICVAGFNLIFAPKASMRSILCITYFISMLAQIFIPCLFAQDVITESVGIINSCYESMWYECTVSTRKFFFIIMERAKRPVALKAGPFFTLSLNTFVMQPTPLDVGHRGRLMLWIFGLYIGDRLKPNPWRNLIRPFFILYTALLPVLIIAKPILVEQDFLDKWISIHFFVSHGWSSLKLLIYTSRLSTAAALEKLLETEIFNRNTTPQIRFISRAVKNIETYTLFFLSCPMIVTIVQTCFVPSSADNLIVPMWIPGDSGVVFWHFYLSFWYILSITAYVAMDSVMLSFVANIICQFQILNDNLKNCCDRDPNESYIQQEKRIQERLRQCVIHHEAILK
ncbi:hypothetical protein Trydic_g18204 [Trypoxylus dichotomus]